MEENPQISKWSRNDERVKGGEGTKELGMAESGREGNNLKKQILGTSGADQTKAQRRHCLLLSTDPVLKTEVERRSKWNLNQQWE
jgi:hypothetical protein